MHLGHCRGKLFRGSTVVERGGGRGGNYLYWQLRVEWQRISVLLSHLICYSITHSWQWNPVKVQWCVICSLSTFHLGRNQRIQRKTWLLQSVKWILLREWIEMVARLETREVKSTHTLTNVPPAGQQRWVFYINTMIYFTQRNSYSVESKCKRTAGKNVVSSRTC